MTPYVLRIIRRIPVVLALIVLATIVSFPIHAQDGAWKIDERHSVARFSLGGGAKAVETGLAHVRGEAVFGAGEPADPVVYLDLKPGKNGGTEYLEINFRSKRSMLTNDGKIAVIGDLSVVRVKRGTILDANEGYYGAVYGGPVVHTYTREVTLLLPSQDRSAAQNGKLQLSISAEISREYFPEFLTVMAPGNWPNTVVQDQECTMPSATLGEGYFGSTCTGSLVAIATNGVPPASGAIGEGYYGFESARAADSAKASISLDLKLTRIASMPSSFSETGDTAGN